MLTEGEIDAFLASVEADQETAATEAKTKQDDGELRQDYQDEILVLRDDVINVESEISQREYGGADWTLAKLWAGLLIKTPIIFCHYETPTSTRRRHTTQRH